MTTMPIEAIEITELAQAVTLTSTAASKLSQILQEKNLPDHGLRVFVAGGGCSGLQYGMAFEGQAREMDTIVEQHGLKVYVDPVSLEYLYRYRSLPLHSMFSVFNNEPYNQFRVSPVVKLTRDLYGLGTLTYTKYKGDNNVRFSLGASYQGQSVGIHFGDGYGGKQIGGFGNLSYSPMKDLELSKLQVIYPGSKLYPLAERIQAIPLARLAGDWADFLD